MLILPFLLALPRTTYSILCRVCGLKNFHPEALVDAVGGVQNLIWVAHNSRTMRNYKRDQRQADIENDDVIVEPKVESLTVYDV